MNITKYIFSLFVIIASFGVAQGQTRLVMQPIRKVLVRPVPARILVPMAAKRIILQRRLLPFAARRVVLQRRAPVARVVTRVQPKSDQALSFLAGTLIGILSTRK